MADNKDLLLQKIKEQGDLVRKLKAAKESNEKGCFINSTNKYFQELDIHLSKFSYICGYEPTNVDIQIFQQLNKYIDFTKYINIKRWWYHLQSFNEVEISTFSTSLIPECILKISSSINSNVEDEVCFERFLISLVLGISIIVVIQIPVVCTAYCTTALIQIYCSLSYHMIFVPQSP